MNRQLNSIRNLLYDKIDLTLKTILDKLEYHERHDDSRFESVSDRFSGLRNDLWEMRLNAAQDRQVPIKDLKPSNLNPI